MIVLGIETSCDETAAAVVTDAGERRILANLVLSQLDQHRPYGGIVPTPRAALRGRPPSPGSAFPSSMASPSPPAPASSAASWSVR
jgi:hypothetical protein